MSNNSITDIGTSVKSNLDEIVQNEGRVYTMHLVKSLAKQLPTTIDYLSNKHNEIELEACWNMIHKLRGSLSLIHICELSGLLTQCEKCCNENQADNLDALTPHLVTNLKLIQTQLLAFTASN